jgi:hypothetical protein
VVPFRERRGSLCQILLRLLDGAGSKVAWIGELVNRKMNKDAVRLDRSRLPFVAGGRSQLLRRDIVI